MFNDVMIMTNDDDDDDHKDVDDRWQCEIFSYFSIFLTFLFPGAVKPNGHDDDGDGDGDADADAEFSTWLFYPAFLLSQLDIVNLDCKQWKCPTQGLSGLHARWAELDTLSGLCTTHCVVHVQTVCTKSTRIYQVRLLNQLLAEVTFKKKTWPGFISRPVAAQMQIYPSMSAQLV